VARDAASAFSSVCGAMSQPKSTLTRTFSSDAFTSAPP
jgi:hypothetical protein